MKTFQPPDCELVTAMVTPFADNNNVDFVSMECLINHLIDTGSDGILVNGTTGESPTVTSSEKMEIIRFAKQAIGSRNIKLIAGTGTNDTKTTIELSQEAVKHGADALLIVVPYYNKPSQKGMIAHFSAVADLVDAPIIIYNIPGRSVVNMLPETMANLAGCCGNIIGVKQSNADMDQLGEIRRLTPESFRIWSGDDSLTLPMMSLGAYGVISVASHIVGTAMRDMIRAFKTSDTEKALKMHLCQMEIFRELFFLPNPTVVKTCLASMGIIKGNLRLPLVSPDAGEIKRIEILMEKAKNLFPQITATRS